ncbi:MAG: methionine--tRNA ligase [Flavobacteriales bacterium]|nr:methionine--tRNA ligase [Flavobacteriales bacterium]
MGDPKRYTVTAALPYANGPLHIGHVAGAYLPADIYVRSLRQRGKQVLFVCGSDEHGAAITMKALQEGSTPQQIVDRYHAMLESSLKGLGVDLDVYHRTSSELHHRTSQEFFDQLYEKGAFTEQEEEQYFDPEAGRFLADRYITGTCPKCGNPGAYGDQCEKCGSALSPADLIDPKSTLSGGAPVLKRTKHWYLPMDQHQEWVDTWLNQGLLDGTQHHDPKEWKPQVLGQCNSWIKDGLRPRAMTRDLDWGVPVPLDQAKGKVLYVWLDAPIGYISATRQWALDHGRDWEPWWKDKDTRLVHFIGKDNIVFHCIVFPILLKEHGGFILPHNVPANEFLNLEGRKLSTSRNWAVWVHEYLDRWPGREDVLRYTLTTILPEFRDSEFTWKDLQEKNNNELVAILGNFVQRVFVLCHKYFEGKVPESKRPDPSDVDVLTAVNEAPFLVRGHIDRYRFREALAMAMMPARLGNKYLTDTEPWKLHATDPDRVATILYNCLNIVAALSHVLGPFLPFTVKKLQQMLGIGAIPWADILSFEMPRGQALGKPEHLFSPITDEEIQPELERLHAHAPLAKEVQTQADAISPANAIKPLIQFDDFARLDLRTGLVLAAERIPKADKLLKLTVDIGEEDPRTVISGIAAHYGPEEVVGRQVVLVANLEPRKMRGVLSEGMVLMSEDADGKLVFVAPDAAIRPGSEVR